MNEELTTLEEWKRALKLMHISHHVTASFYAKWNMRVGITLSSVAAIVGTSVLVNLGEMLREPFIVYVQVITALLSFAAAALAGIQTFVNFPQRSQSHHLAAAKFQRARRTLQILAEYPKDEEHRAAGLKEVKDLWYEALKSAPNLPSHIHDRLKKKFMENTPKANRQSDSQIMHRWLTR